MPIVSIEKRHLYAHTVQTDTHHPKKPDLIPFSIMKRATKQLGVFPPYQSMRHAAGFYAQVPAAQSQVMSSVCQLASHPALSVTCSL